MHEEHGGAKPDAPTISRVTTDRSLGGYKSSTNSPVNYGLAPRAGKPRRRKAVRTGPDLSAEPESESKAASEPQTQKLKRKRRGEQASVSDQQL